MKIAVLAPFPFVQAEFGGGERIYNLLSRVDADLRVFVSNIGGEGTMEHKNMYLSFHKIPEQPFKVEYDMAVIASARKMYAPMLESYKPDLVILEHPWQVEAIDGHKFIYDAHNNETAMKQAISGEATIAEANRVEQLALNADHVTYCSKDDNLDIKGPNTWIPNGTDIPDVPNLVGHKQKMILFTGSGHPPNIGAAITLASLAAELPDYHIVIAGDCSRAVRTDLPNVSLLGHVNKETLDYLFRTAHAFVNPIAAGSGTSLKILRALSYGVPVISSAIGARGYTDACIVARTAQEVTESLGRLQDPIYYKEVSEASRAFATGYSWDIIGKQFNEVVQSFA